MRWLSLLILPAIISCASPDAAPNELATVQAIQLAAPTSRPTPTPIPTLTAREYASAFCSAYGDLIDGAQASAASTQDFQLIMFLYEIQAIYYKPMNVYCEALDPPPLLTLLESISPDQRWDIPEDAQLGNNATVCLDFYNAIHDIFIGTIYLIINEKPWEAAFLEQVARIDHSGEVSGDLVTASAGQFCPSIIEHALAQ